MFEKLLSDQKKKSEEISKLRMPKNKRKLYFKKLILFLKNNLIFPFFFILISNLFKEFNTK